MFIYVKFMRRLTEEDVFEEGLDEVPFEFEGDFFIMEFSFSLEIPLFICCHTASTLVFFSGILEQTLTK